MARDLRIAGSFVYQTRGTRVLERLGLLGIAVEAEKDVVSMIAATEQRDPLMHSTPFRLPEELPDEAD